MKRLLLLTLTILWMTSTAFAITFKGAGKVINFTGNATISRGGQEFKPAKGLDLYVGDSIHTREGKVSFIMADNSMMSLTAGSDFNIKEFSVAKNGTRKGAFNLAFGKVKSAVSKSVSADSHFEVRTPTAVAGVRGTEFVTGYDTVTKKTDVAVLSGIVNVASFGPSLTPGQKPESVNVGANQKTSVQGDKAPSTPTEIPKNEIKELKKGFDITKEEKKEDTQTAKSDKSNVKKEDSKETLKDSAVKEDSKDKKDDSKEAVKEDGSKDKSDTKETKKEDTLKGNGEAKKDDSKETLKDSAADPKKENGKDDSSLTKKDSLKDSADKPQESASATGEKKADTGNGDKTQMTKSSDSSTAQAQKQVSPDVKPTLEGSQPTETARADQPATTSPSPVAPSMPTQASPPTFNTDSMNIIRDRMDITSSKINTVKEQSDLQKSSTGNVEIRW